MRASQSALYLERTMTPAIVSSLLAALDFFLHQSAAFAALATVNDTCGMHRNSRIRLYSAAWDATFIACQEAMLVVGVVLAELAQSVNTFEIPDRDVGTALARVLGERERFERALTNYRSALTDFQAADARYRDVRDRAGDGQPLMAPGNDALYQEWKAKERADDRRGTWYRELHSTFSDYDRALLGLNGLRERIVADRP